MRTAFATAALLAFLLSASTAPAQTVVVVPPLSVGDVQAIAAQNGVAAFYRVDLDEGVWKIEGRDLNGRYVYMRIDPRTGQVVKLDRGLF
jgi:Peptidase propeptide and YPEB domain